MDLCRTSNTGFQKNAIIEETLTAQYIQKVSTRKEYLEKFREYKEAYKAKWKKAKANGNAPKYLEDTKCFVEDMKPYNRQLRKNEISKTEYLNILNKRKKQVIY